MAKQTTNSNAIYISMKKLISKKYYATAEEAQTKLDTYYACNRLSEAEYTELSALVVEVYGNKEGK